MHRGTPAISTSPLSSFPSEQLLSCYRPSFTPQETSWGKGTVPDAKQVLGRWVLNAPDLPPPPPSRRHTGPRMTLHLVKRSDHFGTRTSPFCSSLGPTHDAAVPTTALKFGAAPGACSLASPTQESTALPAEKAPIQRVPGSPLGPEPRPRARGGQGWAFFLPALMLGLN